MKSNSKFLLLISCLTTIIRLLVQILNAIQEDKEEQKCQLNKKELEEIYNDSIKAYTNMMNHIILRAKESADIQSDQ